MNAFTATLNDLLSFLYLSLPFNPSGHIRGGVLRDVDMS